MDILEFYLGVLIIVVAGSLIGYFIRIKGRIADQKLAEELRVSDEKRKYARMKAKMSQNEQEVTSSDFAPWVGELLGTLGISPEILLEDQMPPELQKMMPFVKSFISSGGLQKILGSIQPGEAGERTAI